MMDNIPLLLFVSYCVGVPVIIFLTGLFGGDNKDANIIGILWPILVPIILIGAAMHSFGEYLHKKLTPDER